jgi:hypothetical protein
MDVKDYYLYFTNIKNRKKSNRTPTFGFGKTTADSTDERNGRETGEEIRLHHSESCYTFIAIMDYSAASCGVVHFCIHKNSHF